MNTDKLLKALEDDRNEILLQFNSNTIKEMTLKILKELHLPKRETLDMYKKLRSYKYVDEVNDVKVGTYVRWIQIEDPDNIHLTKGAIFCEFKKTNQGVLSCVCKNFSSSGKHFQISMETNLLFQKLTPQETVLLSALDHLSK
jgi:hypothetical protein